MAKTEKNYISIDNTPNEETVKSMQDAKAGRVTQANNKKDFFAKLNS